MARNNRRWTEPERREAFEIWKRLKPEDGWEFEVVNGKIKDTGMKEGAKQTAEVLSILWGETMTQGQIMGLIWFPMFGCLWSNVHKKNLDHASAVGFFSLDEFNRFVVNKAEEGV